MGTLGMIVLPSEGLFWYSWAPLILDWGCVPGELYTAVYVFRARRGKDKRR
jgi:hypothetical protein